MLKSIFNATHQESGHQAAAVAGALHVFATNVDNLSALAPALEIISQKHASLMVEPDQYVYVGDFLLKSMRELLGDAVATTEFMEAWEKAYWVLANMMMEREKELYEEVAREEWDGWRDYKIASKVREGTEIVSFYLEPVVGSAGAGATCPASAASTAVTCPVTGTTGDMKKAAAQLLPRFKPGQYISVNIFVDDLDGGVWQARQYSLSDAPGKPYLRISVKREDGNGELKDMVKPGYVSNILHDK